MEIEFLDFMLQCDFKELKCIVEEMNEGSSYGAKTKMHLISHINAVYQICDNASCMNIFPHKSIERFKNRKAKIEEIIKKHQEMMLLNS